MGAWQIGGDWGNVDEDAALATLQAAAEAGVNLIDTRTCTATDAANSSSAGSCVRTRPAR